MSYANESYTEKCDIWSLGAVFFELLTGLPAFHVEAGTCDGYTEDIILREIQDITAQQVVAKLEGAPVASRPFLERLLTCDPVLRPSAREALDDPYLAAPRVSLVRPTHGEALPMADVVERLRAYGKASKTTRASLLAMARSPTQLPWKDFVVLRTTFDIFDSRELSGSVGVEAFLSVVADPNTGAVPEQEGLSIWEALWGDDPPAAERPTEDGDTRTLSYLEFLAALLPPIEDAFEDVEPEVTRTTFEMKSLSRLSRVQWDPSLPVSHFLSLCSERPIQDMIFAEDQLVAEVVRAMCDKHLRWIIVRYASGRHEFFDYMDINHKLVEGKIGTQFAEPMAQLTQRPVGELANCSGHASFEPLPADAPFSQVLILITRTTRGPSGSITRRVPVIDIDGRVLRVFSCLDFLDVAMQCAGPSAVLRSRSCRTFDRRDTMIQVSALHSDTVINAFRIMDSEHLTICPTTSRELSGDLGGVVATSVISVSDLKWVVSLGEFGVLDKSVQDFVAWRTSVTSASSSELARWRELQRFKVVAVGADDSLHILSSRLIASKLQRIFLSSAEIGRIVGCVSSRDILTEVLDELIQSPALD